MSWGKEKKKQLNNKINPLSVKTIKCWDQLWYENMKGSINPLINWAHSTVKKTKKNSGEESNKQPLVPFTKKETSSGREMSWFHIWQVD